MKKLLISALALFLCSHTAFAEGSQQPAPTPNPPDGKITGNQRWEYDKLLAEVVLPDGSIVWVVIPSELAN